MQRTVGAMRPGTLTRNALKPTLLREMTRKASLRVTGRRHANEAPEATSWAADHAADPATELAELDPQLWADAIAWADGFAPTATSPTTVSSVLTTPLQRPRRSRGHGSAEVLQGPVLERLGGADRPPGHAGDVLEREIGDEPQRDHLPLFRGQLEKRRDERWVEGLRDRRRGLVRHLRA